MRRPRILSREDAELWGRVARTVKPLAKQASPPTKDVVSQHEEEVATPPRRTATKVPATGPVSAQSEDDRRPAKPRPLDRHGLDGTWEKKLARADLHPDFTLDLHGHSLDAAYTRLEHGLGQALAMGARLVLVITGLPRPVDAADRGQRRGAIRAKLLDWLAHGSHAHRIASVRGAHRRHGGAGAVYVVLKRTR
jgi:DNA-nicking Smr family endonuclease